MTERLTQLMRAEADALDIPAPPAAAAYAQGRGIRRRQRLTTGVAAAAVLAIIGAGGALGLSQLTKDSTGGVDDAAAAAAYQRGGAFAGGNTVVIGDGKATAQLPHRVHALYYTSVGVVARHKAQKSDPAPNNFTLVRPDGSTRELGAPLGDSTPAADPEQPYLVWPDVSGAAAEIVVLDVRTGDEAARVPLPSGADWGDWSVPEVSLSGDIVYVGTTGESLAVNWRTEDVAAAPVLTPGTANVDGGRTIRVEAGREKVVDARSGETLLDIAADKDHQLRLSTDGRYAVHANLDGPEEDSFKVYSVATGTHAVIQDALFEGFGWSPDGRLLTLNSDRQVETCDPDTGQCTDGSITVSLRGDDPECGDPGPTVFVSWWSDVRMRTTCG